MQHCCNISPIPIPSPIPHLMLVGCGSVGSFLAVVLSRVCNRLTVVDPEELEAHNASTHTIAFALAPNSTSKAHAVQLTLNALFAPCHVSAVWARGEEVDFEHLDFGREITHIIIATDTVQSRINVIQHIRNNIQYLPNLKNIIDTGISPTGYRITVIKPEELPKYVELLKEIPERAEDATRACEQVRSFPVILTLATHLLQLLGQMGEGEGEPQGLPLEGEEVEGEEEEEE